MKNDRVGAISEDVKKPSTGWRSIDNVIRTTTDYTRDESRDIHPEDRIKLCKALADRYSEDAEHWRARNARDGVPDR